MWYLKIKYKHSDCIYLPKLQELGLSVHFFYLGMYEKDNYVYASSMQQVFGDKNNVKKYVKYLKNHKNIAKIEVYDNIIISLAKHKKDIEIYYSAYDPLLLHPFPTYLSNDGFEIIEFACWQRRPLEEVIKKFEKGKTTTYFEILQFKNKSMEDIYIVRLLPKLSKKQEEAIKLAFQNGYYNFPRKTNLDKLAKIIKVSKPTFRENLRKAEAKLMPQLISK